MVVCSSCHASGPTAMNSDDAVKKWNDRNENPQNCRYSVVVAIKGEKLASYGYNDRRGTIISCRAFSESLRLQNIPYYVEMYDKENYCVVFRDEDGDIYE